MRPDPIANKLRRFSIATALFLLAYVLCISLYQLVTGGVCMLLDYEPYITFNALLNLPIRPDLWSKFRVLAVFGGGALWLFISGIAAIAAIVLLNQQKGQINLFRVFLLWFVLLTWNLLFTLIATSMAGSFDMKWGLYQGLALVISWWKVPLFFTIPMAIIACIASVIMGYLVAPEFLKLIYSSRRGADSTNRIVFLLYTYVLPIIVGGVMLLPLLTEYSLIFHMCLLLNLVLISFGVFLRSEYLQLGVKACKADVLNTIPIDIFMFNIVVYALVLLFYK